MRERLLRDLAVLVKELRTRMRGPRAALVITVYLLVLAGLGSLVLQLQQNRLSSGGLWEAPRMGQELFALLSVFQLLLVVFIVPGLTGAAIAGERDRQTLDLLLSTRVSSLGIVLGKLLSSLSYVLLLLLAALPVFSLAFLFGGVSPRQIVTVFALSLVTAVTLGAIGVALSTLVRRGQMATVLTYAVTFFLVFGTGVVSAFVLALVSAARGTTAGAPPPLALNPVAALLSAMSGLDGFLPSMPQLLLTGPGGPALDLWQANLIADAVLVALCLYVATVLLRPGGRLLPRLRRRAAPAGGEAP